MNELILYTAIALPSGRTVDVRPRSYMEWEVSEEKRFQIMEQMEEARRNLEGSAAHAQILRLGVQLKTERLTLQVKDFESLKGILSLGDIALIEKKVAEMEGETVPLGNSGSGGLTQ